MVLQYHVVYGGWLDPLNAKYIEIFALHDHHYETAKFPREQADEIMLSGLKEAGMPLLKRQAVYRAVRVAGGSHYKKTLGERLQ